MKCFLACRDFRRPKNYLRECLNQDDAAPAVLNIY